MVDLSLDRAGAEMTDTPRTDAELKRICEQLDGGGDNAAYVMSQLGSHARTLELELTAARAAHEVDAALKEATK